MIKNKQIEIKKKGFKMFDEPLDTPYVSTDFSKIKVGMKSLDDAIYNLGDKKKAGGNLADKTTVLNAIKDGNLEKMREISNYFYKTSGIYSRLCRYLAYLYRYDWMVTPFIDQSEKVKTEKIIDTFHKILYSFDNFEIKRFFGEVALKVIRAGCYYGYYVANADRPVVQELPPSYCRSRFFVEGRPAIEFNMKYFDDAFSDKEQRERILGLFPPEFKKGYNLYKAGKLVPDFQGDQKGWYLLDPKYAIKFNINGEDFPFLISVIPAIIDLDAAQELDRKKMEQKLLKILIQKMPVDKNGDLVFDVDEAKELHNNAVKMLGKAIGIDVLTTFADVEVADMADRNTTTSMDELTKVERTVYNEAGVSQMQFNTDGNIALEKSILNDEATMYNLLTQFESFLNFMLEPYNKNVKKCYYRAQVLTTTIYNYKEMSKLYKEQTQMGYSKILPQIALGQSQSSILANAYFENDVLELINVFIPPLNTNVLNADMLNRASSKNGDKAATPGKEEKGSGRPTKESQGEAVAEKTIQNKESAN